MLFFRLVFRVYNCVTFASFMRDNTCLNLKKNPNVTFITTVVTNRTDSRF